MQVDTLSQHVCSEDDVIFVLPLFPVGVEVLADGLEQMATILGGNHQYVWAVDTTLQVFYRIHRFREDHYLSFRVAIFLEQFMLQQVFELGKLGIIIVIDIFPLQPHIVKQRLVVSQLLDVILVKVFALERGILGIRLCLLVHLLLNLLLAITSLYQRIDIQVGSNEYLVILPHVNHVLVSLTEGFQRLAESIETTFQTLYQSVFADACQTATDNLRIVV